MKIQFHGATGDVTGSAYHVMTKHANVLIDCGMFQGGKKEKAKNRRQPEHHGSRTALIADQISQTGHGCLFTQLSVEYARVRQVPSTEA